MPARVHPPRVLLLLAVVIFGVVLLWIVCSLVLLRQARTEPVTIAIIPFLNESGRPEDDRFVGDVTERLEKWLRNFSTLHVLSSLPAERSTDGAREPGKELSVSYIVRGSINRVGETGELEVRVFAVTDSEQLWSESMSFRVQELSQIESKIAADIARVIELHRIGSHRELKHNTAIPDRGRRDDAGDLRWCFTIVRTKESTLGV